MKQYTKSFENTSVLIIVVGFALLGWIFNQPILFIVSVVVGIMSLISGWIRKWVTIGWMGVGRVLGWINSRIILTIIFFLVLYPLSWFQARKTKQKFNAKHAKDMNSNFIDRKHNYSTSDFDQMW